MVVILTQHYRLQTKTLLTLQTLQMTTTNTTTVCLFAYLFAVCLSLATAVIAAMDTPMAPIVEESSVAVACPVAKRTSPLAEHGLVATVANARLPAGVPLTVRLSAACRER